MSDDQEAIVSPKSYAAREEIEAYDKLLELSRQSPIPDKEVLANLSLFLVRPALARLLFLHNLYVKSLATHGVIMDFGARWGRNMALFTALRNIYEPYNSSRKIIGFDTFSGYLRVAPLDRLSHAMQAGDLAVTPNYENHLEEILSAHEKTGPRSHVKKFEVVRGDVVETLPAYLKRHPETVIALAYFDMDLYEPTKRCLELIRPHLVRNSIISFNQLSLDETPGETQALKDAWGTTDFELVRDVTSAYQSYFVVGSSAAPVAGRD